jgi:ubiquinone/menaquinone biosynthesis C-methylase UbiE
VGQAKTSSPGGAGNLNSKAAFDKQAPVFDSLYGNDAIIAYKRKRVRDHVEEFLAPQSSILELNAGTGEDATYFASKGHHVHATDISEKMQQVLEEKVKNAGLQRLVTNETCSFTELEKLGNRGPFDYVFSNFAGLNCTNELETVLRSLPVLLKPGGHITLVVLPKFCLWEFILMFKGKFRTAFRRFAGKKGARAHIEGQYFRCWYYNPSFVLRHLKNSFTLRKLEGLCTVVPPSYIEGFAKKHPKMFRKLVKKEDSWKLRWPWRSIGDYYIITLQFNSRSF